MKVDLAENHPRISLTRGSIVRREKNKFLGIVASVKTQEDCAIALNQIIAEQKLAEAKHLMYAYRLPKGDQGNDALEYFNDDREYGAGRLLLTQLKQPNRVGVMLVVARWCNMDTDSRLGKARFDAFKEAASSALLSYDTKWTLFMMFPQLP